MSKAPSFIAPEESVFDDECRSTTSTSAPSTVLAKDELELLLSFVLNMGDQPEQDADVPVVEQKKVKCVRKALLGTALNDISSTANTTANTTAPSQMQSAIGSPASSLW